VRHDPWHHPPPRARAACATHRPLTPRHHFLRAGHRSTSQVYITTRRITPERSDKSHDARNARSPYDAPRARVAEERERERGKGVVSREYLTIRTSVHRQAASSRGAIWLRRSDWRGLQPPRNASGMRGSRLPRRFRARGRGAYKMGKRKARRLHAVGRQASFGGV
jgi:hypothetical protein